MQNMWQEWLEDTPQAAYYGSLGGQSQTPAQRRHYDGNFSNMWNRYMGNLGGQAIGGQQPMGSFTDFLGGFDWNSIALTVSSKGCFRPRVAMLHAYVKTQAPSNGLSHT